MAPSPGFQLLGRATLRLSNATSTTSAFSSQWTNPQDVLSVLLIIGGDVVKTALAQSSGHWFSPVCFSFGWVAYSFTSLISIIGEGRLLPIPDYPVKVFNLKSGYVRDNKNWVIGRILRDNESQIAKNYPLRGAGIRITIYDARKNTLGPTQSRWTRMHANGLLVMIAQLAVASIPIILHREWGIMLITVAGTILALMAGALPQWIAEKLPNRQETDKIFALTTGNGATDIMIIKGLGHCLDLEELSASDTPRTGRPWEKFPWFSKPRTDVNGNVLVHDKTGKQLRESKIVWNHPLGFWVTRIVTILQSVLWLALLVTVAGLQSDTWYLLIVGGIGMFQNAFLAAAERKPEERNLPLRHVDTIICKKVMDGLMDLESTIKDGGRFLKSEFFPGELRDAEKAWWNGDKKEYDDLREEQRIERGSPQSTFSETSMPSMKKVGSQDWAPSVPLTVKKPWSDDEYSDTITSRPTSPIETPNLAQNFLPAARMDPSMRTSSPPRRGSIRFSADTRSGPTQEMSQGAQIASRLQLNLSDNVRGSIHSLDYD